VPAQDHHRHLPGHPTPRPRDRRQVHRLHRRRCRLRPPAAVTAVIATALAIIANGDSLDLSNSDLWRTLAGGIACNAAFAAIGVSLGALIPNLAAAIATALAWIALVEGLIGELFSDLEPWLPFAGGQALVACPAPPTSPNGPVGSCSSATLSFSPRSP